jgi:hypothetical protein
VQLIAMMITGLATRDLAVPTPPLADYPPLLASTATNCGMLGFGGVQADAL